MTSRTDSTPDLGEGDEDHDDFEDQRDAYEREALEPEHDPWELTALSDPLVVVAEDPELPEQEEDDDPALSESLRDPKEDRRPLETYWLTDPLRRLLKLYDQGLRSEIWRSYFEKDPHQADIMDRDFTDAVVAWFDDVERLDVQAIKSPEGKSLRKHVFDLDQQIRTLYHLCYPLTSACTLAAYFRGHSPWDFSHTRELLEHEDYGMFQKIRTWVYSQTPAYKAKKRDYNKGREELPEVKARREAQRRARTLRESQDPGFKAREAERKRLARLEAETTRLEAEENNESLKRVERPQ